MANLDNIVYDSFHTYAGMVIADRAIVDVRDCLKPSPRVLLYNQYRSKNFSNKPFVKSAALVGEALKTFYYHSDSSCYQMYCRMAAPYAMRYPLNNFHGNYGALSEGGQPAAMRYTEMRLSPLSTDYLFAGLNHNAVAEWRDNFDETDQSPRCLPSIGYYNICNGSIGLGIGVSSSIPQFNLKEVNKALIYLIQNPNCDFDKIYCPPDFASGATIVNAKEVKESLEKGNGAACRIRSVISYNRKSHELLVSELPYGVYSETIVNQVKAIIEKDEEYGIVKIFDNSSDTAEISFELSKDTDPNTMIRKLYKDTSLEDYFSINMIMLDKGRFPKVFGWREACLAYIEHIRECKRREIQFDLDALVARNHVLKGLLIAIAHIDEVVKLIRSSENVAKAKQQLIEKFGLDDEQAKAILDMKLQRLANLEAIKINKEFDSNEVEIDHLNNILGNQIEIDKILIEILQKVANDFGDARRTKLTNLVEETEEIERQEVYVSYDEKSAKVYKRNVKNSLRTSNLSTLVLISSCGKMYKIPVLDVMNNNKGIVFSNVLKNASSIIFITDLEHIEKAKYWAFATKEGFVKKTNVDDYNYQGRQGSMMTKLKEGDSLITCDLINSDKDVFKLSSTKSIPVNSIKLNSKNAIGAKVK